MDHLCNKMIKKTTIFLIICFTLLADCRGWDNPIDQKSEQEINMPIDRLVAYYPFNGNANDESGNGNTGVINGATLASDRYRNLNSAYYFDGSSKIICPTNNLLNNAFSYSVWINISTFPQNLPFPSNGYCVFAIGDNSSGDQAIILENENSVYQWRFASYYAANSAVSTYFSVNPLLNTWYHIVIIRNNSEHNFFLNSLFMASTATNGKNPYYGTSPICKIGTREVVQFFKGIIDDIRIYNRALSDQEIQALYHEGSWGK